MKLINNKLLTKFLFGLLVGITFKVDSAIWNKLMNWMHRRVLKYQFMLMV